MFVKIVSASSIALLSACNNVPIVSNPRPPVPIGYVCTLTPTTAFSPGYVYRQASNGEVFLVEEIPVAPKIFEVALGGYTANFNTNGGLTANLQSPASTISGNANIGGSTTRASNISFTDGNFLQITDREEKQAIQSAIEAIGNPRAGDRYFMVRDVIQAKGIKMSLSGQDTTKIGGESSIERIVNLTPNLTVTRGETFDLSGTFQNPLNVCMRAVEFAVSDPSPVPVSDPANPTHKTYASPADIISIFDSGK